MTTPLKVLTSCLLIATVLSCQNSKDSESTSSQNTAGLIPSDFTDFYQKFHQDSVFQMEHITWPLDGAPDAARAEDITAGTFRWQQADWRMHRPIDFQMSSFKRELLPMSDDLIIERIYNPESKVGMVRRFAKLSDGWHLIYYAGMNRVN